MAGAMRCSLSLLLALTFVVQLICCSRQSMVAGDEDSPRGAVPLQSAGGRRHSLCVLHTCNNWQSYEQERDCLAHFLHLLWQCVGQARKVHETTTFLLVTLPNNYSPLNSRNRFAVEAPLFIYFVYLFNNKSKRARRPLASQ